MNTPTLLSIAAGVTGVAAAHIHAMFDVRSPFIPGTTCQLPDASDPQISLTFDDGPHRDATPAILDVLGDAGVKAAFFMIGACAAEHPDLVARVAAEGHIIGNHSYSHLHSGVLRGRGFWEREITQTTDVINEACGVRTRWFRPPIGHRSFRQQWAVRRTGHHSLGWTCRSLDGVHSDADAMCIRVMERLRGRDILVMHDGVDPHRDRDWRVTVELLTRLLPALEARGITPVELPNLDGTCPSRPDDDACDAVYDDARRD